MRSGGSGPDPRLGARALLGIAAVLVLVAVERLLSASMLGFVLDESRSVRLATAFICGGLAPVLAAFAVVASRHGRRR